MIPESMKFKFGTIPTLDGKPVVPKLKVTMPRDVENKKGWTKTAAVKDALNDAWKAAWKRGSSEFAKTFIEIFKEEIDEYIDWNPDDILLTIRLPIKGLRWIPLKKIRLSDLEKWVEN